MLPLHVHGGVDEECLPLPLEHKLLLLNAFLSLAKDDPCPAGCRPLTAPDGRVMPGGWSLAIEVREGRKRAARYVIRYIYPDERGGVLIAAVRQAAW